MILWRRKSEALPEKEERLMAHCSICRADRQFVDLRILRKQKARFLVGCLTCHTVSAFTEDQVINLV